MPRRSGRHRAAAPRSLSARDPRLRNSKAMGPRMARRAERVSSRKSPRPDRRRRVSGSHFRRKSRRFAADCQGYRIVARRWKNPCGRNRYRRAKRRTLAFVEVKARAMRTPPWKRCRTGKRRIVAAPNSAAAIRTTRSARFASMSSWSRGHDTQAPCKRLRCLALTFAVARYVGGRHGNCVDVKPLRTFQSDLMP